MSPLASRGLQEAPIARYGEFCIRETPYRKLHGTTLPRGPIWFRECLFQWAAVDQPWNFSIKRQEATRLNHGEEATLDSIPTRPSLNWLIVNDPVAHGLSDSLQVSAWKVIDDIRFVVVDRIRLM